MSEKSEERRKGVMPPLGITLRLVLSFLLCAVNIWSAAVGAPPPAWEQTARDESLDALRLLMTIRVPVDLIFAAFWAAVGVGMLKRVRRWEVAGLVCAGLLTAFGFHRWFIDVLPFSSPSLNYALDLGFVFFARSKYVIVTGVFFFFAGAISFSSDKRERKLWYAR